jgi:ribonuclease J
MPERLVMAQLEWTHVWLAAITALWGGLVSYFRRVQQGMRHSWVSVFIHMSMSGFAGLLCWLGCLQFEVPGPLTAICTGLAGHMGAEFIKIKNSDIVVFSSNPIPGNEKYVVRTVDGLMREGSEVIQNGKTHLTGIGPLHLSGHGYYDDHVKLINALNPTYYLPIHGEFHMLVHNAKIAEKEAGIPRDNIFVSDSGDVIEITTEGAKKNGRVPVGGIMYDDSGAIVSEVVLKDRIHMATEGMFVVVLTVQRGSGRLMTSPDIISRGFIYLRDSEELMNLIRQYLKQKVTRVFSGKRVDMDQLKKELKDEITHLLYDQTRRTPIVIPVINEIGGGGNRNGDNKQQGNGAPQGERQRDFKRPAPRQFPKPVVPDTEANDTKAREAQDARPY